MLRFNSLLSSSRNFRKFQYFSLKNLSTSSKSAPPSNQDKKPSDFVFLKRSAIKDQIRSIVKNLDQFHENRETANPEEQKKIGEEHVQELLNKRILKREFVNDAISMTLKGVSLFYATAG